jgi:hypothetical protein
MTKIIYIIFIILYIGIISGWCYRFPISYKLTNGSYNDLVVDHDFKETERDGIKKAYQIRQTISNILLYCSVMLSVSSYIIFRNHSIDPRIVAKIIMITSGLIAIILILVNGIHFIPGPLIR